MEFLFQLIGNVVYFVMALLALWGAYCLVMTWRRVAQTRFRNEKEQEEFFEELEPPLNKGKFDVAVELCDDDIRALPQLALYAIENRKVGVARLQRRLVERFQQDVLADIEHRLSWVSTVSKSAPMVGLFGTVMGMMGAFSNLSTGTQVDTGQMAGDIMFALITTALGLAIAVPLVIGSAGLNIQIRKMEDLVSVGLARLLDNIKAISTRG
ncbi:MAG: MotA/TolQ/ExbB proton channel family protein [Planctomycetales bacterium]|nr:MotA/TolQ/ExbB proton channel family protein [Planctomycetales bacterium]